MTSVVLVRGEPAPAPVNEVAILLVVIAYSVVAVIISIARPGHVVGRLMLCGSCVWGVGEGLLALAVHAVGRGEMSIAGWLASLGSLRGLGWLVLVLGLPLAFPDGHMPWRGRRPVILLGLAIGLFSIALLLAPSPLDYRLTGVDRPTGLPQRFSVVIDLLALSALFLSAATLVVAIAGLVHRWRTGDDLRRQQLLWFSIAFAAPLLLIPVIPASFIEPWMFAVVSLPVPIAIAVALFQNTLYDIQLVVNRTVTFVALSAAVAALYAVTVGGVGVLLRDRGAAWLPWVAAGVVAVAFAPLHNALQRGVNRLTYGQWSQPADVLASTGRRLADSADVPGLVRTLIDELGSGLGLRYVEIVDSDGRSLAAYGSSQEVYDEMPLTAYGQTVGSLRLSSPKLRASDRQLLDDLAGQIGVVVHSARLIESLREAQERLVLAREEERRRLRRDLHDGLGPALAGLTLQVDMVRNVLAAGEDADAELLRLRTGVASTVLDVRRIVEGLRPPALDELGLEGALVQLAERTAHGSDLAMEVSVPERLPEIPAAVEVAAYRVTQEALSNAVRHSGATQSHVVLSVDNDGIRLEVSDNGNGEVRPRPGGIGLTTMHERAAEVGGS
ncbi:MAG: hypothetical protein H0V49_07245 [Nocardioidaceae bacterium]|nr:hypothetical protein [Nocardioidaceae bacterium]